MILEGNERGYGAELARHLMNARDNDHVTLHAVNGFVAADLAGALAEAEAISGATQCQKYLFSLSLNPPAEASVSVETFETTIAEAAKRLGLEGQPYTIVFHEKNGRRHAHCVWSRIDGRALRAINLPHYKRRLVALSQEIYLEQGWAMPEGFRDAAKRDPLTFRREEAGQAKRAKLDPKALKALFRACWEGSDTGKAFEAALLDQGFVLACGDRRGFVAIDGTGKVWSLSRWCGVASKELEKKIGVDRVLPSVDKATRQAQGARSVAVPLIDDAGGKARDALVSRQRQERAELLTKQEADRLRAMKARPKGLRAAFLRLTGRYAAFVAHCDAQAQAERAQARADRQALIDQHLKERRDLDQRTGLVQAFDRARDPRQRLVERPSPGEPTKADFLAQPDRLLADLSHHKASFTRTDVIRALAAKIDDPVALAAATDQAMASDTLVRLPGDGARRFTTQDYQSAEEDLHASAERLAKTGGPRVAKTHIQAAKAKQNASLQAAFGGQLSAEQSAAVDHVLGPEALAQVVGLAGAGKSTMLATAAEAWTRQGIKVHGAALAGKAAEGLEEASGIRSRTMASLELAWKNGADPIKKGDVLVVDEAGMIGTRQMARLVTKMHEIGAKLVLVGDPDQLQPIEAGTPFRDLVAKHGAARLTEIHRQRVAWQRTASKALAAGNIADAVQSYRDHGAVQDMQAREAAIEALVETYAMDVLSDGPAQSRLALAHRRKDVHALNQGIRAALRETAYNDVLLRTETGDRAFCPGDRIVFGKNERDLGVKNGMLGTVERVSARSVSVTLDGEEPRRVTFDPRIYQSFDHGYAVTIHKSQGATVDQSYVLSSRSMDRHLAYVAMTRHRTAMTLFGSRDDRPSWSPRAIYETRRMGQHRSRDGPSLG